MKKFFAVLCLVCTACTTTPLRDGAPANPRPQATGDAAAEKRVVLPHQMNQYLDHLDSLVGLVCFTVPNNNSCANATLECTTLALKTGPACPVPNIQRLGRVILNDKFEGKVAANLSFLAGAINVTDDRLIEAIVQEDSQAQVKPDAACIDQAKVKMLMPKKWCSAVWESSVTSHVVSYRQYEKLTGNVNAGLTAISAGKTTYISDDSLNIADYLTGYALSIDDLMPCSRDETTQICSKKNVGSQFGGTKQNRMVASSASSIYGETLGSTQGTRTLTNSEVKALSQASIRTDNEAQAVISPTLKKQLDERRAAAGEQSPRKKQRKITPAQSEPAGDAVSALRINNKT